MVTFFIFIIIGGEGLERLGLRRGKIYNPFHIFEKREKEGGERDRFLLTHLKGKKKGVERGKRRSPLHHSY